MFKAPASRKLQRIKWDTLIGMGFSNLTAFFIILSTAATLHKAGITHIETSAQAAQALRPLAGDLSFGVFSQGILGWAATGVMGAVVAAMLATAGS
jgi:Mn2+/Fe2+ NRAMP family transporter